MNKVILIGRLSKDVDLRFTQTGTAVAGVTVAVNKRFKKEGQAQADFIPVVIWGKIGEAVANHLSKGSQIGICGRMETRSYDAQDGTKRYITEVIAEEVEFLGGKKQVDTASESIPSDYFGGGTPVDDGEDIPF